MEIIQDPFALESLRSIGYGRLTVDINFRRTSQAERAVQMPTKRHRNNVNVRRNSDIKSVRSNGE